MGVADLTGNGSCVGPLEPHSRVSVTTCTTYPSYSRPLNGLSWLGMDGAELRHVRSISNPREACLASPLIRDRIGTRDGALSPLHVRFSHPVGTKTWTGVLDLSACSVASGEGHVAILDTWPLVLNMNPVLERYRGNMGDFEVLTSSIGADRPSGASTGYVM